MAEEPGPIVTEEALRLAEEKYRSIFENAVEGIFQTTPEGRYLKVNPALAKMHGFASPEEMMASLTNIGQQLYVDPARRDEFARLMREQGIVRDFESQVYRKDGSIIWCRRMSGLYMTRLANCCITRGQFRSNPTQAGRRSVTSG